MDSKLLKKTRASYKAKFTIFKTYIDSFLPTKNPKAVQVLEITARLNKITELYNESDTVQTTIESLVEIPGDETSYFACVADAKELLSAASAGHGDGTVTGSNNNTGPPGGPTLNYKLSTFQAFLGAVTSG